MMNVSLKTVGYWSESGSLLIEGTARRLPRAPVGASAPAQEPELLSSAARPLDASVATSLPTPEVMTQLRFQAFALALNRLIGAGGGLANVQGGPLVLAWEALGNPPRR
jgi:hypothetical protein